MNEKSIESQENGIKRDIERSITRIFKEKSRRQVTCNITLYAEFRIVGLMLISFLVWFLSAFSQTLANSLNCFGVFA